MVLSGKIKLGSVGEKVINDNKRRIPKIETKKGNNLIYIETPKPSNTLLFELPREVDLSSIIYPLDNSMACSKGCQDTSTTPNSVAPILCSPGDSNFACSNFDNNMTNCLYNIQGPDVGPYYNCFYDDTNDKCIKSNKKCFKQ